MSLRDWLKGGTDADLDKIARDAVRKVQGGKLDGDGSEVNTETGQPGVGINDPAKAPGHPDYRGDK